MNKREVEIGILADSCSVARQPGERNKNVARSQRENWMAVSATKFLVRLIISLILCAGSVVCARAQDAQSNETNESWTATTQASEDNANPSRTLESHTKSGNRSVDKKRTEVLGVNGGYEPASDSETETIQVNSTTTRTVVRTYRWDPDGQQRSLVAVTEEEERSSPNGDTHVVSTTSNPDVNGNLQVVQRQVADTRKTSPDAQETTTTVYNTDGSGGLTPSLETQESRRNSADHTVAVKTTTLLPDGNGKWELGGVKEDTIKEEGKNRTSEERVSRPNSEGGLSEASRTVSKETENAAGEKSSTVETYSTSVSGLAPDGGLHLNSRATTVDKKDASGKTTEQQVEQANPDNSNAGLQVTAKTKYTVHYAASGTQQTKTIETRDTNGNFNTVYIETGKSAQVPAKQDQKAPSDETH